MPNRRIIIFLYRCFFRIAWYVISSLKSFFVCLFIYLSQKYSNQDMQPSSPTSFWHEDQQLYVFLWKLMLFLLENLGNLWRIKVNYRVFYGISFFFRHQIWFKISLEKILVSLLQDIMHTTMFALAMYFPKFSHFLQRTSFGM